MRTARPVRAWHLGTGPRVRQLRYMFVQELVTSGMITIGKVLGTLGIKLMYLPSMATKKHWRGMFPLLALGQVVSTESVVLEYVYVSQTLYMLFSLEPNLVFVSSSQRDLGSLNAKRFARAKLVQFSALRNLVLQSCQSLACI